MKLKVCDDIYFWRQQSMPVLTAHIVAPKHIVTRMKFLPCIYYCRQQYVPDVPQILMPHIEKHFNSPVDLWNNCSEWGKSMKLGRYVAKVIPITFSLRPNTLIQNHGCGGNFKMATIFFFWKKNWNNLRKVLLSTNFDGTWYIRSIL